MEKLTHIHIVGICGTFMAGIAGIAKDLNFKVTGCDQNVYPPMSDVLQNIGITITQGYEAMPPSSQPDLYIIGNAAKRGMPIVEDILTNKRRYLSGPEWLYQYALKDKTVLAVAGTHGKTTTSTLLAWVLEHCGENPSFLIGGAPSNFKQSARCVESKYFVIEADEYDTAFFDKRSKMVHYRPDVAIINNLEFDHADIFDDLHAIQKQFHGMIRVMPAQGLIICPNQVKAVDDLLAMGTWSEVKKINAQNALHAILLNPEGSQFKIMQGKKCLIEIDWHLIGWHNVQNALAVFSVCLHLALPLDKVAQAFKQFKSVKRRLELKDTIQGVKIYDDFAHHPTAIKLTVKGLRDKVDTAHLISIVDFGSHTMRSGLFFDEIIDALEPSDVVYLLNCPVFDRPLANNYLVCNAIEELGASLCMSQKIENILIMSNKSNQALIKTVISSIEKNKK